MANLTAAIFIGAFNWYGFLIAFGIIICFTMAYFIAKYRGLDPDMIFDIAIVCVPSAIIGARVYFLIFEAINGVTYNFWQAIGFANGKFDFSNGNFGLKGLAIYGGIIGGVLGGLALHQYYKKKGKDIKFTQMMDLAAPLFLVGQCIGRWGNFANQELYGAEITNSFWQFFPIAVKVNGVHYQALFFYESFLNLIGACLLLYLYIGKRRSFPGFIMAGYCIWYGFTRIILEGMRQTEFILYIIPGILPASQFVSALIIITGIAAIIAICYRARQYGERIPLFVSQKDWKETGYDLKFWGEQKPIFARQSKVTFEEVDEEDAYWMESSENGGENADGKKPQKDITKKADGGAGGADGIDKPVKKQGMSVAKAEAGLKKEEVDKPESKKEEIDRPVKKQGMSVAKAEAGLKKEEADIPESKKEDTDKSVKKQGMSIDDKQK